MDESPTCTWPGIPAFLQRSATMAGTQTWKLCPQVKTRWPVSIFPAGGGPFAAAASARETKAINRAVRRCIACSGRAAG